MGDNCFIILCWFLPCMYQYESAIDIRMCPSSWTYLPSPTPSHPSTSAAKSLQSCPTLCDPRDDSPPGSPVSGILQARTLEWVAISFSNAWKWKVKVKSLSHVQLLATPWTAAHQAPLSMGFFRQEYWSGVPLPSPPIPLGFNLKSSSASWWLFLHPDHQDRGDISCYSLSLPDLSFSFFPKNLKCFFNHHVGSLDLCKF